MLRAATDWMLTYLDISLALGSMSTFCVNRAGFDDLFPFGDGARDTCVAIRTGRSTLSIAFRDTLAASQTVYHSFYAALPFLTQP